jgi:hypothetical protein
MEDGLQRYDVVLVVAIAITASGRALQSESELQRILRV